MSPMKFTLNPSHTRTMFVRLLVSGLGTLLLGVLLVLPALAAGSGTWTATGSLNIARADFPATLLTNGQVLVAGGCCNSDGVALDSAELYNSATGIWTTTASLNSARVFFTATLLQNGQVLVAGGDDGSGFVTPTSAELYNPSTGTWTLTGSMNTDREQFGAVRLQNGQVLVAGGGLAPLLIKLWPARSCIIPRPEPGASPAACILVVVTLR